MSRHSGPPRYRLHRRSGQAVVTFPKPFKGRRDHYLGPFGTRRTSPESWQRYDQLIAEWLLWKDRPGDTTETVDYITVGRVADLWLTEAGRRYVKNGTATPQLGRVKLALGPLCRLYSTTRATAFGPRQLLAVREAMIALGWARSTINSCVGVIKTMFAWAATIDHIPGSIGAALKTVKSLPFGAPGVVEPEEVEPVAWETVQATLFELCPMLRDLIMLLYLTGARPCEICRMRARDVDQDGRLKKVGMFEGLWVYDVPAEGNKNAHKGRRRVIFFGPAAQRVLRPRVDAGDPAAYLFSPREAAKWWVNKLGRTFVARRQRAPGEFYRTRSLDKPIQKAARRAGVAHWSANQLRHTRATEVLAEFGGDAVRVLLGHSLPGVTGRYTAEDFGRAAAVMREIG